MTEEELVAELLEITPTETEDGRTIINTKQMFNERSKEILKELSERYKKTGIYKRTKEQQPVWIKIANAAELYLHMCERIANAPTTLLAICTPKILIPVIWEKIQEEELGNGSSRRNIKRADTLLCNDEKGNAEEKERTGKES